MSQHIDSVVGSLFFGKVDDNHVFPFPQFTADQSSLAKEIIDAVDKFAVDNIKSTEFDEKGELPHDVLQGLAALGLCGLAVEEEFGGMQLDYSLYSRVFEQIAGIDGAVATTLGAHQSIGYRAIINEGSPEQKTKWLPKLASGESIAAFCLTEPGSGSDAYSIKTKATKNADGTYTIKGQKLWITNGGLAEVYTVFCKTDHEVDGKTVEKISCLVVEKGMEGLSFGEKENKMGIRASETRAVYFDNVKVPAGNLIGEEGKGFKIAMNVLNSGRLSLGAGSVGGMKRIMELATEHARTRKQFDKTINEFGLIQEKLATMASLTYAAESVVYLTTGNIVRGMKDYYLESAVCKVFNSECLWEVVDTGLQIAAGNGYMKEYPYERLMRDSRINLIFEGTNEILRCFIALSGIKEPSEDLKELGKIADVSKALQDPIKSLGVLTDFAKGRISKMVGSRLLTQAHPLLEDWGTHFSNMLGDFAIQVENTLMKYGRKIIDHELPQKRLANMTIQLYAILAVISRTTLILNDEKIDQKEKDYCLALCQYACRDARHKFMTNFRSMNRNADTLVENISKMVSERGGYGLDIVNF